MEVSKRMVGPVGVTAAAGAPGASGRSAWARASAGVSVARSRRAEAMLRSEDTGDRVDEMVRVGNPRVFTGGYLVSKVSLLNGLSIVLVSVLMANLLIPRWCFAKVPLLKELDIFWSLANCVIISDLLLLYGFDHNSTPDVWFAITVDVSGDWRRFSCLWGLTGFWGWVDVAVDAWVGMRVRRERLHPAVSGSDMGGLPSLRRKIESRALSWR